ncbi:ABC transporter ATP-binding protein [Phragmitibacter flavus]|uniref:ABC transporter ATP-binding protein n=1 Tax=Phragmitibacter flavus TaxID=2576071 RepID=A0A5R8KKQ9_9BACT|nr:oligopeptide/dipeptide ABC transporter ATP-binding protein [Phragmitibacter flavus]TLD72850.1 ABC transporter ATP-binding protein [Phragmitibacter flavus]
MSKHGDHILEVRDLVTSFDTDAGRLTAVDGISFNVPRGKTMGIVGESGCGKSVTAFSITRLLPQPHGKILGGSVKFEGQELTSLPLPKMQHLRGNEISMIFQEPMTALNPVQRVGRQLAEAILLHTKCSKSEVLAKSVEMFRQVRIPDPEQRLGEYPHQLSGGMRQRVMIAMALINRPKLLIADEPTTALDVTVQAQILELIADLQKEMGMSVVLITHDLGVIAEMCDEVAVMYAGRIVEQAPVRELFANPQHAYTRGLLESMPKLENVPKTRLPAIPGNVPSIENFVAGCRFAARSRREHLPEHLSVRPPFAEISPDHWVEKCPVCAGNEIANASGVSYNLSHEQDSGTDPRGALESAQSHLGRGQGANRQEPDSADRTRQLKNEFDSIVAWAKGAGRLIPADRYQTPEESGAEHRVYFDPEQSSAIKITNANRAGMSYPDGEPHAGLPAEYLERWRLHNLIFADDVTLEGVIQSPAGVALVVRQCWINGTVPEVWQIADFMNELGFQATLLQECYYRAADDLAVMDCHDGNFMLGDDGMVYPIDVIPLRPDANLKQRLGISS